MQEEPEDEFSLRDHKNLLSLKGRATFLYISFGAFVAVLLFRVVLYLMSYLYLDGTMGDIDYKTINVIEDWFEISIFVYLGLWVFCIISFCVWVYAANKNLKRFGLKYVSQSPSMAVIWNFLPVANFWMPFLVMMEIGRGTNAITERADPLQWKKSKMGAVIPWWWITRLIGFVLFIVGASLRSAGEDNLDQGLYNDGTLTIAISMLVVCVSAILLIRLVSDITKKHELQSDFIQ